MEHTLVVLISGSGTNLQALIDAQGKAFPGKIVQVISNKKNAYGLERAQKAGIPTTYHNLVKYRNKYRDQGLEADVQDKRARNEYDEELSKIILKTSPSLVVCAGWMHILAPTFLNPLEKAGIPVINLHPALPGHRLRKLWQRAVYRGALDRRRRPSHRAVPLSERPAVRAHAIRGL